MARGEQFLDTTSQPFEARYDGDCGAGDTIDEGETIVMLNGEAWHAECAIEANYRVPGCP